MIASALAIVLTASQLHWATVAYQLGEPYGESLTLSAIIGQESSYCQFKRNGWSFGCAGTKRATVRFIFDGHATRARLESDNLYSIKAGLSVLLYCRDHTNSWRRMVACFHWGLPYESKMSDAQIDSDAYVLAIVRRLHEIKLDTN